MMKTILGAAAFLLAAASTASAGDIRPLQGHTIDLGAIQGVAYYTVSEGRSSYDLVATFAGESGVPMRVSAALEDGESLTLTVPAGAAGDAAPTVDILRVGDVVRVAERAVVATN